MDLYRYVSISYCSEDTTFTRGLSFLDEIPPSTAVSRTVSHTPSVLEPVAVAPSAVASRAVSCAPSVLEPTAVAPPSAVVSRALSRAPSVLEPTAVAPPSAVVNHAPSSVPLPAASSNDVLSDVAAAVKDLEAVLSGDAITLMLVARRLRETLAKHNVSVAPAGSSTVVEATPPVVEAELIAPVIDEAAPPIDAEAVAASLEMAAAPTLEVKTESSADAVVAEEEAVAPVEEATALIEAEIVEAEPAQSEMTGSEPTLPPVTPTVVTSPSRPALLDAAIRVLEVAMELPAERAEDQVCLRDALRSLQGIREPLADGSLTVNASTSIDVDPIPVPVPVLVVHTAVEDVTEVALPAAEDVTEVALPAAEDVTEAALPAAEDVTEADNAALPPAEDAAEVICATLPEEDVNADAGLVEAVATFAEAELVAEATDPPTPAAPSVDLAATMEELGKVLAILGNVNNVVLNLEARIHDGLMSPRRPTMDTGEQSIATVEEQNAPAEAKTVALDEAEPDVPVAEAEPVASVEAEQIASAEAETAALIEAEPDASFLEAEPVSPIEAEPVAPIEEEPVASAEAEPAEDVTAVTYATESEPHAATLMSSSVPRPALLEAAIRVLEVALDLPEGEEQVNLCEALQYLQGIRSRSSGAAPVAVELVPKPEPEPEADEGCAALDGVDDSEPPPPCEEAAAEDVACVEITLPLEASQIPDTVAEIPDTVPVPEVPEDPSPPAGEVASDDQSGIVDVLPEDTLTKTVASLVAAEQSSSSLDLVATMHELGKVLSVLGNVSEDAFQNALRRLAEAAKSTSSVPTTQNELVSYFFSPSESSNICFATKVLQHFRFL